MKPTVSRRGGTPPDPARRTATAGGGPSAPRSNADVVAFVRSVIAEMKRVTWPSREEWVGATILTVALVVGVGLFTWFVDLILAQIFTLLTGGAR